MRVLSITIECGLERGVYKFSDKTLVYSEHNSVGKTTLLRCILYSLGYPIPAMRGMNFNSMTFKLSVQLDSRETVQVKRVGDTVEVLNGDNEELYFLPAEQNKLHQVIFGIENDVVLENLLGAFYCDQEKGWTLLNRGKAIGRNKFKLEDLILGLSGRSCCEIDWELKAVLREYEKYKQMFNLAEYQKQLSEQEEAFFIDTPLEGVRRELDRLYCEQNTVDAELRRLRNVIKKNSSFESYITAMSLRVQQGDVEIPVTAETIVGYIDNVELLNAKKREKELLLEELKNKILKLSQQIDQEEEGLEVKTQIQEFDKNVLRIKIDQNSTRKIISSLKSQINALRNQRRELLSRHNPIVEELEKTIQEYARYLEIDSKYTNDILTSDLKSLSGSIFHRVVFVFKISYVKVIQRKTGVLLPLIIDSPMGGEVETRYIDMMMEILNRDFQDNQIIIASIHKLGLSNMSEVPLTNGILHFPEVED